MRISLVYAIGSPILTALTCSGYKRLDIRAPRTRAI
jgi:hypothetical protein